MLVNNGDQAIIAFIRVDLQFYEAHICAVLLSEANRDKLITVRSCSSEFR